MIRVRHYRPKEGGGYDYLKTFEVPSSSTIEDMGKATDDLQDKDVVYAMDWFLERNGDKWRTMPSTKELQDLYWKTVEIESGTRAGL